MSIAYLSLIVALLPKPAEFPSCGSSTGHLWPSAWHSSVPRHDFGAVGIHPRPRIVPIQQDLKAAPLRRLLFFCLSVAKSAEIGTAFGPRTEEHPMQRSSHTSLRRWSVAPWMQ